MSPKNKSYASNPLTPLSGGIFRKFFIGIFAGFLLLNVSVVNAGQTTGSTNTNNLVQGAQGATQDGWENGVPTLINTPYFQGLDVDNTDASPIYGMSQGYYNYTKNWHNYKNVTPVALEKKSAGATATSPYVFADEFNTIVGALRGIWNAVSGSEHFFGINGEPTDGVRLTVHGEVQLGNFAGFPTNPQAGEILFNTSDSHFWYYNGSGWRQLDTPDCDSCDQAHEYTCEDDNDGDNEGVWNGGTVECNSANYDLNHHYYFDNTPTVCAVDSDIDNANCIKNLPAQCSPIENHYETRCIGGVVTWVDDCGRDTGDIVDFCGGAGCHDIEASPQEALAGRTGYCSLNGVDHTDMACAFKRECREALGDDAATCEGMTHPMHPQYSSGQACASGEVGCGTGSSWSDPYDTDDYKYDSASVFYYSPRNPNVKFAGICNDQGCGAAENEINVF